MKQLLTTILMHEDYFLIFKWQEFSRYINLGPSVSLNKREPVYRHTTCTMPDFVKTRASNLGPALLTASKSTFGLFSYL